MLQVIVYLSCALAFIAFGIFAALGLQRFLLMRALNKRLAEHKEHVKTFEAIMASKAELFTGLDKTIEAISKLTDSLSKAPFHIAALVVSMVFLLIALAAIKIPCVGHTPPEKPKEATTQVMMPQTGQGRSSNSGIFLIIHWIAAVSGNNCVNSQITSATVALAFNLNVILRS